MVFSTLGATGFTDNMALWGKSFSEVGLLFKTSFGNAFADVNSKFDLATSNSEKFKASLTGVGQGLKGVFTIPKGSPLELMSDGSASKWISKFAKATDGGAEAMQLFNGSLRDPSMKSYLKTVDAGGATLDGYKDHVLKTNTALKATSLSSKAAAVGMNILNAAMNMGIMLAITGLIQLAVKGFDALTVTFEEQQEKVDGLKQKFEECTSKIETLTSQLEENRKKIAEINANPLSIVDSTTLTTLQSENAELERQIELNKQITKDTNKQLGVETSKLLEKESQKSETKKTTLEESTVLVFSPNNVLRPHM